MVHDTIDPSGPESRSEPPTTGAEPQRQGAGDQGSRPRRRLRLPLLAATGLLLVGAGTIAVPNLARANLNANEAAVIAALKNICSAQSQCQASGVIDVNGNGAGEYGFFGELTGAVVVRTGASRIDPPVLSNSYAHLADSRVARSGYLFQMFLPDRNGGGVAEDPAGGDPRNDNGVDPSQAEILWCCYAWPKGRGWTGRRTFFVNQAGDVLATNGFAVAYDGAARACPWSAAFAATSHGAMGAMVAANTVGVDGNTWTVV